MDTTTATTQETEDFFDTAPLGTGGSETREQFTLQTREHCDWYLKKIAALDAEEALITAQAEAMLRRVRADRESLQGRYQSQLESFVRGELERTKSRKRSLVFFHGTAQFTNVAPRLVIESELDAITTARAVKPQTVTEETVTKLDKKTFLAYAAAHFEETGELVPGVGRTEASERFVIKTATKRDTDPDE